MKYINDAQLSYRNKAYYDFLATVIDIARVTKDIEWLFSQIQNTKEAEKRVSGQQMVEMKEALEKTAEAFDTWKMSMKKG